VRVLFLGLGGVGQRHLRNLRSIDPDAEVAAVRHVNRRFEIGPDLSADPQVDIVAKYGVALFPSTNDAVDRFRPDCAVIASPTSAHAEQLLPLLRAGIPTLLEKPATSTEAELDDIRDASAQYGTTVMLGYMLRFHPTMAELERAVRERMLGAINSATFTANSYLPAWHPYEGVSDFYAGRSDLGGGVILTESHIVDLMHHLLGAPKRVWSVGGKVSTQNIDVEDSVTSLFEYAVDGRTIGVTVQQSFVQRPIRFAASIACERGRIEWNLLEGCVWLDDAEHGRRVLCHSPGFDRNRMFIDEMMHFLDCVRGHRQPLTALGAVLTGERTLHRMRRSLADGSAVSLH
jgi:predicted dehydrogenase